MVTVAALEAIRTGTTTIVENAGGIGRSAAALAQTGLRCVFAESIRDSENVAGPMSPEGLARSEAPRFSPRLRDEGLQRINDLFTAWHGAKQGRISVFPAAALAETSSPELLQAVRAFAEKHDLGYTIHLSQSRAEVDFMVRHHGVRPPAFLDRHGFLGPRLFAAHCRYVDAADIALLGRSGTIVSHQAAMAANRGVIPPIAGAARRGLPDRERHRQQHQRSVRGDAGRAADRTHLAQRRESRASGRSRKTCSKTPRRAARGRCSRASALGSLEVGKKADLLVVDTRRAHLVPAGRIVSAWIHNGQPSDIESVHGRRPVRHAQPQGPHDGRGPHRRRGRQGRTANLEQGAGGAVADQPAARLISRRTRWTDSPVPPPHRKRRGEDAAGLEHQNLQRLPGLHRAM